VQVVEVDDVVLHALVSHDEVAQQPGVLRGLRPDGVLDGTDGGDGVHRRADAADALRESPRVPWVAPLQDELDAPEHGRRRPGVRDAATVHLGLYSQVPLDARDGIDDDVRHDEAPFSGEPGFSGSSSGGGGGMCSSLTLPVRARWTREMRPWVAKAAATPAEAQSPTLSTGVPSLKPGIVGRWR
jgi:hypothetical protein